MLAALGSTMTDKYAEGYPGRRYYGGCEFVDVTEQLAIDRAKELFGAEHANVQPHAGARPTSPSSVLLEPNDPARRSSGWSSPTAVISRTARPERLRDVVPLHRYQVDEDTEQLDMDEVRDLAKEHRPKIVLAGYGLPAGDRLRRVPDDRRRGGCAAVGRCLPFHRPGRRRRLPLARAARRRRDVHHAQGARGPAGR